MKKINLILLIVGLVCFSFSISVAGQKEDLEKWSSTTDTGSIATLQENALTGYIQWDGTDFIEWATTVKIEPNVIANKEEVIKYFLENGDVCDVIGHQWETVQSIYTNLAICYDDNGNMIQCEQPKYRKCKLCGKKQEKKTITKWKDVK